VSLTQPNGSNVESGVSSTKIEFPSNYYFML